MSNTINIMKPSVCFEVHKIIGISTNDGKCKTYQVQWEPTWISGRQLIGCEDLIEQFEREQTEGDIKVIEVDDGGSPIGYVDAVINNHNVIILDDNLHKGSTAKQQNERVSLDNIDIDTNSISTENCTPISNHSNTNLKVSSLNSIIQNISRNNNQPNDDQNMIHSHSEINVLHSDLYGNNRSPLSNLQVDNERHKADNFINDTFKSMVIVREALDCGLSESPHQEAVKYFVDSKKDLEIPHNSFVLMKESAKNIDFGFTNEGGESSRSIKKLEEEESVHSAVGFSCNFCDEKFTDIDKLLVHMKDHQKLNGNPLECPYCSKRFSHVSRLKVHTRVHTGECPFKCNICHKRFKYKYDVKRHLKTHIK